MSVLVITGILGLFVNTMIAGDKNSFVIVRTYSIQFKYNCLRNKKLLWNFLLHFSNLHQTFKIHRLCISKIMDCERRG